MRCKLGIHDWRWRVLRLQGVLVGFSNPLRMTCAHCGLERDHRLKQTRL